jgi:uncharacterized membrane protein
MNTFRSGVLLAATLTTGLAAGVFALYAHTIMPALKTTDDRTFVAAFQAIDRGIINPWFMAGTFFAALVSTAAAAATNLRRPASGWVIAALGLYVVVVVVTVAVNVPLNDAIKAAGDPAKIDVARVRNDFHESRWAAWNLVRVAASIAAFASLAWALVLDGRAATS